MSTIAERIFRPEIVQYLGGLSPDPGPVAREMEEEAARDDVPILTRDQGRLLALLARLQGAQRILEVGTGIGYGTLFLARALPPGGELVTIDIDPARHARARSHLETAGVADRVRFLQGAALEVLPSECSKSDTWDFVLLDAVKEEYRAYVEICAPSVRSGGMLAVDNLLWMGMAAGMPLLDDRYEASTEAIRAFNPWFLEHPDFAEAVLVPIGDGMGLAVKA